MQEWQQHVIQEKEELEIKIEKLQKFLSNLPSNIDMKHLDLLNKQYNTMSTYRNILVKRINLF